jgi:hypothetical protein
VLKVAGEIETTQNNVPGWLEPDEGGSEFQHLVFL